MFICSLRNNEKVKGNQINKVLIRIHGNWLDQDENVYSLITMFLGEKNLGPKLLGVFPGGRIEEFIEVSDFGQKKLLKNIP